MSNKLKITTNPEQSLLLDETLLKFRGGVSGGGMAWWSDNFQECLGNHPKVKEPYENMVQQAHGRGNKCNIHMAMELAGITETNPVQVTTMTTYPHDWVNELNIDPEEFKKL